MGKKVKQRRSDCPISVGLELFGDKWTFLIIRDLMFKGKSHYAQFLQSEEKIATNILADRLLSLEGAGVIEKTIDPSHALKYIYKLTPKGIDLMPVLIDLILWSAKYDKNTAADMKFVKRAKANREELMKEIRMHLESQ